MKPLLKLSLIPLLLPALTGQAELTVTNIATGYAKSFFIKSDGSLWAMGANGSGDLGDGTYNESPRPELIVSSNVMAVAGGDDYSLFLKSDGSLWGMGDGGFGQLGDGSLNGTNLPEQIVSGDVVAIAAGSNHSLFIKSDGSLWAMGNNTRGELGDGTTDSGNYYTNRPEQIVASGVVAIAAGSDHSLFVKSDGSLWAMGWNQFGQLGDGTSFNTNAPEQIVPNNVIAVAAGSSHSLFLKSDGSLWAMGYNYYGQLGDGTFNNTNRPEEIVSSNVVAIAAGWSHSLFLKSDGSLWVMGDNYYGELGDGTLNLQTNRPEQIISSNVSIITSGDSAHSIFVKSDGSLWGMGDDWAGQLGDGFSSGSRIPEQIFPSPQPALAQMLVSNTNLQFTATCGFGGNFSLLGSPDLALPLSQWTPLGTNSVTTRGTNNYSVTLTNAFNPGGQQFYILQSR